MKKCMVSILLLLIISYTTPAQAVLKTFVSIGPQKWLVDMVGGEMVNTGVLVNKGQDPHTFEPTPKQIAALSEASIWFTMGIEFENQLVKKIRGSAKELHIVDIARHVHRLEMGGSDEKRGHLHTHDEADDGHSEGRDPHVWLSPENLQQMAVEVTEALVAVDPAHAAEYERNRESLNRELEQLNDKITQMLSPYKGASFYVYHPSFGYFADSFGLEQHAIELGGKSPSPRQIAKLVGKARAENVRVIFVQPQFDPKSARAIALAIEGEVVPLDALAEDVANNLETMAEKIKSALTR